MNKLRICLVAALLCATWGGVQAQQLQRVTTCGDGSPGPGLSPGTQDATGKACVTGTTTATVGSLTQTTLDIKTVTTGATAVNALSANHRTKGGWLTNPKAATIDLCINEIGTAVGTVSSGDTTCILPGQSYTISPGTGAVSVISSDSAHPFSGMGLN